MDLNPNIILFDDENRDNLLPLTYTRPVCELRVGITTLKEKWEQYANSVSYLVPEYLSVKYPSDKQHNNLLVNSSLIPSPDLVKAISALLPDQVLVSGEKILAVSLPEFSYPLEVPNTFSKIEYQHELIQINNSWDIFEKNEQVLRLDFERLTKGRNSQSLSETNRALCLENVFIEKGANIEFAIINASEGPVYIGKDATIMEGAIVRGPVALCNNAIIKMGARIDAATTIGPYCKVAGEVHNSVLTGFSSKAHDGYLGNAVLGEWCNLGADTNNSNLKNNYDKVKLWSYKTGRFVNTGLQFCGLIMGDHSKCAINTMFNTGTVVGVSANIFGAGFPRNFIPSFTWGGPGGSFLYTLPKALETARIVYGRRNKVLDEIEQQILADVYKMSEQYR